MSHGRRRYDHYFFKKRNVFQRLKIHLHGITLGCFFTPVLPVRQNVAYMTRLAQASRYEFSDFHIVLYEQYAHATIRLSGISRLSARVAPANQFMGARGGVGRPPRQPVECQIDDGGGEEGEHL